MAERTLAVQHCRSSGVELVVYEDDVSSPVQLATGDFDGSGDQFVVPNDGRTFLHVQTGGQTAVNITVQSILTMDGLAFSDKVVAIDRSERWCVGPFDRELYGDPFKFALSAVNNVRISVMSH